MASPSFFGDGNTPRRSDPIWVVTQKILGAINDGGGSGGGGTSAGSGSPEGVVVGSPGDTYLDTATNDFYAKATGSGTNTGWVALLLS